MNRREALKTMALAPAVAMIGTEALAATDKGMKGWVNVEYSPRYTSAATEHALYSTIQHTRDDFARDALKQFPTASYIWLDAPTIEAYWFKRDGVWYILGSDGRGQPATFNFNKREK
jgi:hypothetical protein